MATGRGAAVLLGSLALMTGCASAVRMDARPEAGEQRSMPRLWDPAVDKLPPATAGAAAPAGSGAGVAGGRRLSVLTFNMQHRDQPQQLAVMADYLRDVVGLPDFILCQEVLFGRPRSRGAGDTAEVLAGVLGYHCRGSKRHEDREGVAIVSRYPFLFYDERYLAARTSALLLGFRRVSAMGEFEVPVIGRVRVVTTHLAYLPFEGHVRRRQMDETLAWIAQRERHVPAALTIFGGDFNARPGARELSGLANPLITGDLHYVDYNGTDPTIGAPGRPRKRVDYIFVSADGQDVALGGEKLLFREGLWRRDGSGRFWLSDHVPLLHEYVLRPEALASGR